MQSTVNLIGLILVLLLVVISQGCQPDSNLVTKTQYQADWEAASKNLKERFDEIDKRFEKLKK